MAVYLMDVCIRDMVCAWMLGVSRLVSVCIYSPCARTEMLHIGCVRVCVHAFECMHMYVHAHTHTPSLRPSVPPSLRCARSFSMTYTREATRDRRSLI
jgi:hypothetical protein